MPDEVPAEVVREGGRFGEQFLNLVFAEEALAGIGSLPDDFGWPGFRNGEEFDVLGGAAGASGCFLQIPFY